MIKIKGFKKCEIYLKWVLRTSNNINISHHLYFLIETRNSVNKKYPSKILFCLKTDFSLLPCHSALTCNFSENVQHVQLRKINLKQR